MNPNLQPLPGDGPGSTFALHPPGGFPVPLRCLKYDELVRAGDFVMNARQEFELWEGPAGFRADSFLKPIYRRADGSPGDEP